MKFSVTERATFRRCRRMWEFSSPSRQNLTGIGAGSEPLELGSLVHRALADWILEYEKVDNKEYLKGVFLKHASRRQEEITEAFVERTGRQPFDSELESLHNVILLGVDMMANYQQFYGSPVPAHMRFAMPEQEIVVPVPGTEHHLSATLDGLLQDKNDRLYVLEHKTYENRPKLIDLQMQDQFVAYIWVARELKIGRVVGLAYDGMWKRSKPPKYMQREKRAGVMEDLFIRKIIEKSNAELDEFGRMLALEINEMADNPPIYPNIPWQGCSNDCSFIDPCNMMRQGEDPSGLLRLKYTQRLVVRGGHVEVQ